METYIIIGIIALILLSGLFIVKQQTAAIVERFGRFSWTNHLSLSLRLHQQPFN